MRKKLLLSLWVAGLLGLWTLGIARADVQPTNMSEGNWLTNSINQGQGVQVAWAEEGDQNDSLVQIVKNFINWVLWILALIVLVIVLIWGFQMVTASGNEEKYKKWFTILKHAGIGLVIIWLSWFIVTIVFRLLRGSTWAQGAGWQG